MSEIQQSTQQNQFYLNTPWYEVNNCHNILVLVKEFQLKEDQQRIFNSKCHYCGNFFIQKRQEENKFRMAMIYLVKWLCFKIILLNAIEDPLFKSFCYILNPIIIIPPPAMMISIIIAFSDCLLNYQIRKTRSKYFSIFIDGKTQSDMNFYINNFIFVNSIYIGCFENFRKLFFCRLIIISFFKSGNKILFMK